MEELNHKATKEEHTECCLQDSKMYRSILMKLILPRYGQGRISMVKRIAKGVSSTNAQDMGKTEEDWKLSEMRHNS